MNKILNNQIKDVLIEENCLHRLNEHIEKNFINSQILFLVDFYSYKFYYDEILQIQKCSLNNVVIKVVCNYNCLSSDIKNTIDETFALIVGIGSYDIINFTQNFAIKNNINFAYVNLYGLKSEIFCNFMSKFGLFGEILPTFILINKIKPCKNEIFKMYLNIYKYTYLMFDNPNFEEYFLNILNDINENNIYEKIVALGLVLNKFKLNFFVENSYNEFKNFIYNQSLLIIIKNLVTSVSKFNLGVINSLKFKREKEFLEYKNFNLNFYKFYLLSNKKYFINKINKILLINKFVVENLKRNFVIEFYKNCVVKDNFNICNIKNNEINVEFLNKMKYFTIFDEVLKMFA